MSPDPVALSVVIPCFNGADILARQLDALQRQRVGFAWEIVVADNGSTDATAAVATAHPQPTAPITVCDAGAVPGINHARNTGVQSSRGAIVVLCDADDAVGETWLAEMHAAFADGATLVGGRLLRVTEADLEHVVQETGLRDDHRFLRWPAGANCGFTRAVYDEIGGFDESYLGGGDETDFFWRAQLRGHALRFVPAAAVYYTEKPGGRRRFRQHLHYGRSAVKLYKAYARHGMRRSSWKRALWFWAAISFRLVPGLWNGDVRRVWVGRLGQRVGRLRGSVMYRTVYL